MNVETEHSAFDPAGKLDQDRTTFGGSVKNTAVRIKKFLHKNRTGQGMVEFALAFPIILVLMMGIIEGGRLMFMYTSLAAAGREAARYGAGIGSVDSTTTLYNDCDGIREAATRIGFFAGVEAADVRIFHDNGPDTTATEYCQPGDPFVTFERNDRILVEVDVDYAPIVPLIPIPSTILHTQSAHTVLIGAEIVAVTKAPISGGGQICDVSMYEVLLTDPTGPNITVTVNNVPPSTTPINISEMLIIWDTTGSPVLQSVYGNTITTDNTGPTYYLPGNRSIASGTPFTVSFSRNLRNPMIIRMVLDNADACAIGR